MIRSLWYRLRPYVLGDLRADFDYEWVVGEDGRRYQRTVAPARRVYRVRRKPW